MMQLVDGDSIFCVLEHCKGVPESREVVCGTGKGGRWREKVLAMTQKEQGWGNECRGCVLAATVLYGEDVVFDRVLDEFVAG